MSKFSVKQNHKLLIKKSKSSETLRLDDVVKQNKLLDEKNKSLLTNTKNSQLAEDSENNDTNLDE